MVWLGVMYLEGKGVPKDIAQGTAWLQKAARLGDKDAQDVLKRSGVSW